MRRPAEGVLPTEIGHRSRERSGSPRVAAQVEREVLVRVLAIHREGIHRHRAEELRRPRRVLVLGRCGEGEDGGKAARVERADDEPHLALRRWDGSRVGVQMGNQGVGPVRHTTVSGVGGAQIHVDVPAAYVLAEHTSVRHLLRRGAVIAVEDGPVEPSVAHKEDVVVVIHPDAFEGGGRVDTLLSEKGGEDERGHVGQYATALFGRQGRRKYRRGPSPSRRCALGRRRAEEQPRIWIGVPRVRDGSCPPPVLRQASRITGGGHEPSLTRGTRSSPTPS